MIIAGTGHRPDKLPNKITGYNLLNPTYQYIRKELIKIIEELKPEKIISGMALGYDTVLAEMAINLKIPLIAAVPFTGQEKIWPKKSQDDYNQLLNQAQEIVIVCEGGYAGWKMQQRNEFLVQNCDILIACFINNEVSGGTFNCIQYAKKQDKDILVIDPTAIEDINEQNKLSESITKMKSKYERDRFNQ